MIEKTLEEYKEEEKIRAFTKDERDISDRLYANKQTELRVNGFLKALYWILAFISAGTLGLLGKALMSVIHNLPQ